MFIITDVTSGKESISKDSQEGMITKVSDILIQPNDFICENTTHSIRHLYRIGKVIGTGSFA
jgi:hypothetical protein